MSKSLGGRGVARDASYGGDEFAQWDIPSLWKWLTVANIGAIALGRQRSPKDHAGPQMRRYVRAANITWSGWSLDDVKEMNFDDAEFAHFKLRDGDVLINEGSGSAKEVGKPAIWREQIQDCCFQNTLLRVRPTDTSSEYLYLYFLFSALTGRFVSSTQGVNIFHIGKLGLAKFPVPVPPPSEQRRIVAKIDSLTGKSKRARHHLDHVPRLVEKYKQAVLAAAYCNHSPKGKTELISLSEYCHSIADGDHQAPPQAKDGIPFITISAMNSGRIDLAKATRFVPPQYLAGLKATRKAQLGDVLYAVTGSYGIPALVRDPSPFVFQRHLALLRPNPDKCDPQWLAYIMAAPQILDQATSVATGTAQQTVPLGGLREFQIPHTPLADQREIVSLLNRHFTEIERLAADATRARKLLDRLDQAILAKAFCGELVPQDPSDEPASVLLDRIRSERASTSAAKPQHKAKK